MHNFIWGIGIGLFIGGYFADYSVFNTYKEPATTEPVEQKAIDSLTLNHIDDVSNSTRCYFFNEIPTHLDCVYLDTNVGK